MSLARASFCERIETIKSAIVDFRLQDLPLRPDTVSHNKSARVIRNGLAVQCFNILEDFSKARLAELLMDISASGVPFAHLPESLQHAATLNAVRAIDVQLKQFRNNKSAQMVYVQQYSGMIASTTTNNLQLPANMFFHSASNIGKDQLRNALLAFSIKDPWAQLSGLTSRFGTSAIPSEVVFQSLSDRRHSAAHNASMVVSEADLSQSVNDAIAIASSFDILMSKAAALIVGLTRALPSGTWLFDDHRAIPLRFIKRGRTGFGELKENASRFSRASADWRTLVAPATTRSLRENGALGVFDATGILASWVV